MGDIAEDYIERDIADYYMEIERGMPTKNNYKRRQDSMTNQKLNTRLVTGEVRFSFVSLLKPREDNFGGQPKYSATILLPKSDIGTKQRIDAAIEAAKQKGKAGCWNGVIPPVVANPIHDGDGVKPSDGTPFGEECRGHWVFTATTGVDYPPKVVDANVNPIIDPTEVYSGMYGRIAINFNPYSFSGKKGIGCYISTNVQKTRDGDPLGATAPAATDDFGAHAGSMPPENRYGQQGFQQGQPYQQPQQFGQAPQQQQFDPITGAPINGGVYGV